MESCLCCCCAKAPLPIPARATRKKPRTVRKALEQVARIVLVIISALCHPEFLAGPAFSQSSPDTRGTSSRLRPEPLPPGFHAGRRTRSAMDFSRQMVRDIAERVIGLDAGNAVISAEPTAIVQNPVRSPHERFGQIDRVFNVGNKREVSLPCRIKYSTRIPFSLRARPFRRTHPSFR